MNEHIVVGCHYTAPNGIGPYPAGSVLLCLYAWGKAAEGVSFRGPIAKDSLLLVRGRAGFTCGHDGALIDCPCEFRMAHWWLPLNLCHLDLVPLNQITPLEEVAKWAKRVEEAYHMSTARKGVEHG